MGLALGVVSGGLIGAATYDHPDFFARSRSANAGFGALIFGTGGLAVGTIAGAAIGAEAWKPLAMRLDR
ncbi:MAG: prenyltransferase [Gemmatimonadaceae bacterium]